MSKIAPIVGIRMTLKDIDQLKAEAQSKRISLSAYIRTLIHSKNQTNDN
jgi:hypothetical protein